MCCSPWVMAVGEWGVDCGVWLWVELLLGKFYKILGRIIFGF